MIRYSRRGTAHVAGLLEHYNRSARPEAMRNLIAALRMASDAIEDDPAAGLPAPRPYPWLAKPGVSWVKSSTYWIGYRRRPELVIVAVFHERANIPARF